MPYFEFFLGHAFDGRHVHVLPSDTLEAARTLVQLTGEPDKGLKPLDEQGLLSLPWLHRRRDPFHD